MKILCFITAILITYVSTVIAVADQGERIFLIEAIKQNKTDIIYWLIEEEANLDIQDALGRTPLMYAASLQSNDVVQHLIENGASLELTDLSGKTALHYAASSGQTDILNYFYDLDINMTEADLHGKTALHLASEGGHLNTVIFLLNKGEDPYITDSENLTAIHLAAARGHIPVLSIFINKSINVDVNDFANGSTPLMLAATNNETDTSKFLVESGANVNSCNNSLWSTVHAASYSGSVNLVEYLLDKNASLDQVDIHGRTSLFIAVENGYLQLAKYLVQRGSNINVIDVNGNSLMHAAAKSGNLKLIKYLASKRLLLDMKNKIGNTPLLLACKDGHLHVVEYMVKYQCDIYAVNVDGMSSVHAAAIGGKSELVNYLVNKGLLLTGKDSMFRTPLHLASMHGHLPVVKLLVKSLSNSHDRYNTNFSEFNINQECIKCLLTRINTKDISGRTSTFIAAEYGKLNILQYLIENGGNLSINDNLGKSPFHAASRNGRVDVLKFLVFQNININLQDGLGQTPIFDAVEAGERESFAFLINIGAELKVKDNAGRTLMHIAAEKGFFHILNILTSSKEMTSLIDTPDRFGRTATWYAARYGHLNCLSNLISVGATVRENLVEAAIDNGQIDTLKYVMWNGGKDLIVKTKFSDKIFNYVVSRNSSLDLLLYYFHSLSSNSTNLEIESLLNVVLQSGNIHLLENLISRERINLTEYCHNLILDQINQNNPIGLQYLLTNDCKSSHHFPVLNNQTLLQLAANNGKLKALDILINLRADKDFNVSLNNTLFEAVKHDHVDVVKCIMENPSNITSLTNNINYLLELAARNGSLNVIKYLFTNYEYNIDHVYNNGETLLLLAIKSNNGLLVKYLIDSGASIDKKNDRGDSPIHLAINYINSLRVLLEEGVNMEIKNFNRATPLQLAYDSDNIAAARCLLKFGANPSVSSNRGDTRVYSLVRKVYYSNSEKYSLSCEEELK